MVGRPCAQQCQDTVLRKACTSCSHCSSLSTLPNLQSAPSRSAIVLRCRLLRPVQCIHVKEQAGASKGLMKALQHHFLLLHTS